MPGTREKGASGRRAGIPNKRTVQKIIEAAQDVAAIERQGQKKATAVLNDLMQTAMSFAAKEQQAILAEGDKVTQSRLDRFWKAMDAAGTFATALAPYQQPKFKAVMTFGAPPPEEKPGDSAKVVTGKVLKMDDPNEIVRIYQKTIRRIA